MSKRRQGTKHTPTGHSGHDAGGWRVRPVVVVVAGRQSSGQDESDYDPSAPCLSDCLGQEARVELADTALLIQSGEYLAFASPRTDTHTAAVALRVAAAATCQGVTRSCLSICARLRAERAPCPARHVQTGFLRGEAI